MGQNSQLHMQLNKDRYRGKALLCLVVGGRHIFFSLKNAGLFIRKVLDG